MPYDPDFARVYDVVVYHTEEALANEAEIEFVRWVFDRAQRPVRDVLDVGCGAGRFLVPLTQAGYHLTGLDNSAGMLAACRQRLDDRGLVASLLEQDLTTLDANRAYDALMCQDSVVLYLQDTDRILDALARFRRALRPGGVLLLDIWNIFAQWEAIGKTSPFLYEGETLRVEWTETYDFEDFPAIFRGTLAGTYTVGGRDHSFEHVDVLRAMTVGEMRMYLKEAGFAHIEAYPDYNRVNTTRTSAEQLVFIAENR